MFPKILTDYAHQLLEAGTKQLDLPVGIVSYIFNDNYQIVAINCELETMKEGAILPLRDTYCNDVYKTGRTLALTEIEGLRNHPLYISMPLEAYISAPILHNEKIWGTVNFTSTTPHKPFTHADIQLIEAYALLIHKKLVKIDSTPFLNDSEAPHAANQ
jgi:GAF domain-containing protein